MIQPGQYIIGIGHSTAVESFANGGECVSACLLIVGDQ